MEQREAEAMLEQLSQYYGEPVKPISQYCEAFRTWRKAIQAAYEREPEGPWKCQYGDMARDIHETSLHVAKSNLLARLLYEGEELRTEPCPVHKGRWSGCAWGDDACPHCMSGSNITGWLPKE
jgi:hypothetical protein